MPNCSHSSLTVNRALCANITNRIISSIGLTFFQDIMLGTVTHHPGSFVTYHSGSNLRRHGRQFHGTRPEPRPPAFTTAPSKACACNGQPTHDEKLTLTTFRPFVAPT